MPERQFHRPQVGNGGHRQHFPLGIGLFFTLRQDIESRFRCGAASRAKLIVGEKENQRLAERNDPRKRALSPPACPNGTFENKKAHFFPRLGYSYQQDLTAVTSAPVWLAKSTESVHFKG